MRGGTVTTLRICAGVSTVPMPAVQCRSKLRVVLPTHRKDTTATPHQQQAIRNATYLDHVGAPKSQGVHKTKPVQITARTGVTMQRFCAVEDSPATKAAMRMLRVQRNLQRLS